MQGMRTTGAAQNTALTSSSSQMPVQHTSPNSLRGISPGYRGTVDYNASHIQGVLAPTSSPYDASSGARSQTSAMIGDGGDLQSDPLLGASIDSADNRQVRLLASLFLGLPLNFVRRSSKFLSCLDTT